MRGSADDITNSYTKTTSSYSNYVSGNLENFEDNWSKVFSAAGTINTDKDIFDQLPIDDIETKTHQTGFVFAINAIWRWLSTAIAILAIGLAALANDVSVRAENTDFENILYVLSFSGLSKQFTGNDFILTAMIASLAAIADRFVLSFRLAFFKKTINKIVRIRFRRSKYQKQLYIGSGQTTYSAGDKGIAITGSTLDMLLQWNSFQGGWLVKISNIEPTRRDRVRLRIRRKIADETMISDDQTINYDEYSHLCLYLKSANKPDFKQYIKDVEAGDEKPDFQLLVIPASFFQIPLSCTSWGDFCKFVIGKIPKN